MLFADNYEQYKYTQIVVPILLLESPADYEECHYYLDVNIDEFYQKNCCVGTHKIKEMRYSRVKKSNCNSGCLAEWKLEMIVNGGKSENEVINILNELCLALSLKFVRYYNHFQHCGFEGFSYDRMRLERKYAYEDEVFSDNAFSMYCGISAVNTMSSIDNKVFKLSQKAEIKSELNGKLTTAFFRALKCKDKISRYILLYYMFEIMYGTPEYQILKNNFNLMSGKINKDEKRSKILFQYLQQEFGLKEYSSFGKSIILNAGILEKIIITRNDLTHRGDLSKISELMYNHLLPILQEVVKKL